MALWLAPRLDDFLCNNPNIEIRLNSAIWTDPNADLADVIVEVCDTKDINTDTPRLSGEHLVLVCAPKLGDGLKKMPLTEAILLSRKIIIQGRHDIWLRWADATGCDMKSILPGMKVDNAVLALEAACSGLGITIAYSTYCTPYLKAGLLTALHAVPTPNLCHVVRQSSGKPSWHPSYSLFNWISEAFGHEKPHPIFQKSNTDI